MNVKKILLLSATLVLTSTAFAKDKKVKDMNWTKEERTKMADMHSKMADCLRSDKDMNECHKEWMDSCKDMGDSCHMMMGKGKGMMKRHMNKGMDDTANSPDDAGKKQHP